MLLYVQIFIFACLPKKQELLGGLQMATYIPF